MPDPVKGVSEPQPEVTPAEKSVVGNELDIGSIAAALGQEVPVAAKKEAKPVEAVKPVEIVEGDKKPEDDKPVEEAKPDDNPDPDAIENEKTVKDLPEATKARVEKRIGKLTAQREEAKEKLTIAEQAKADAEARVSELEQSLEAAKAAVGQRTEVRGQGEEETTLLTAEKASDIDAYEARLDSLQEFIDDNIDEGYTPDDPEKKSYTPAELRKMQRNLERQRKTLIPKARAALKQRETATAEAKTLYPDLFKNGAELKVQADAMLRDHPALKTVPNILILIGDALTKAAERKAPPKKAEPPKRTAALPSPTAVPKADPSTPEKKKTVDIEKVQQSGGSSESIAGALVALGIAN